MSKVKKPNSLQDIFEIKAELPKSNLVKYHIQIPIAYFQQKYLGWYELSEQVRAMRIGEILGQIADFLTTQKSVIISVLPTEYKDFKITVIDAPQSTYQDIIDHLAYQLKQDGSAVIYKDTDLGASILALGRESDTEKEASNV